MEFEWDEAKNRANREKHGISFEEAVRVFEGRHIEIDGKPGPGGEWRSVTVGWLDDLLLIAVVHTDRRGVTRLISARPAGRKERRVFHGTHGPRKA